MALPSRCRASSPTASSRRTSTPQCTVIALAGNGNGFCGGYHLVPSAERMGAFGVSDGPAGSPLDPATIARNHDPSRTWDPVVDWQMMSRNVRGFMSLFHSDKPVVCKVHGFASRAAPTWRFARTCS